MANLYRIRIPNGYDAELVGIVGTPTAGEIIQGVYSSYFEMHEFSVQKTGRYKLFMKPSSSGIFTEETSWGGANGKLIMGDDFDTHFNGHGKGEGGKIKPEETTFAGPIDE